MINHIMNDLGDLSIGQYSISRNNFVHKPVFQPTKTDKGPPQTDNVEIRYSSHAVTLLSLVTRGLS